MVKVRIIEALPHSKASVSDDGRWVEDIHAVLPRSQLHSASFLEQQ